VRILPEWRSFLSHEVIVRAVGKLMKAGDMIENGPKSLDSGHRVDFLQIGLILCCRYSLSCLMYPEGPRCVEGDANALTVSEGVESGGREVTGRECQVFRSRQSVGEAGVSCNGQSLLTAGQTHLL